MSSQRFITIKIIFQPFEIVSVRKYRNYGSEDRFDFFFLTFRQLAQRFCQIDVNEIRFIL